MARAHGAAEPERTQAYARRAIEQHHLAPAHFRTTRSGLTLSSLGLGTYIGAPDGATDLAVEQAVTVSVTSGRINVLDTAIKYRYQRAERSVGRALGRMFAAGKAQRSELFLATKQGYLAPDSEAATPPDEWVAKELIQRGVLARKDIVDDSHAMSVPYLTDQFERSLANLEVDAVDLLYLHNGPDAQLPVVGRREFLNRMTQVFALYERWRRAGRVRSYGLATWDCLRVARSDPGYLSLEEAVAVAREVGGEEHGLQYLQFPFNLAMPEASQLRNQPVRGERRTLFDAAHELGLGCFTSVPIGQGQFARLGPTVDGLTRAQTALQFARSAPGALTALVGQKRPEHLSENLRVAELPPWDLEEFGRLVS